ncbi:hypothetical protein [Vulcanisaeta distributa]|uniref:hypothetical protein n=1 Tax=Vulcanisaeta distributa TaxID=164451 RepID=UPI0006D270CD|nr:hypothetical protein [Vulcanisaeta distributa]
MPYYNPQLGFLPDLIKGGGFLTAAFLDGGGDALQWIGANTYNIGQNIYTQSQVIANEVQAAAQAGSNWLIQHTQGIPVLNYLGQIGAYTINAIGNGIAYITSTGGGAPLVVAS